VCVLFQRSPQIRRVAGQTGDQQDRRSAGQTGDGPSFKTVWHCKSIGYWVQKFGFGFWVQKFGFGFWVQKFGFTGSFLRCVSKLHWCVWVGFALGKRLQIGSVWVASKQAEQQRFEMQGQIFFY